MWRQDALISSGKAFLIEPGWRAEWEHPFVLRSDNDVKKVVQNLVNRVKAATCSRDALAIWKRIILQWHPDKAPNRGTQVVHDVFTQFMSRCERPEIVSSDEE